MTPPTHPRPAALPLLLLASAVLTLCLVVSGQAAELVRPAMVPLLVIAAAVLLMLFVAAHVATEQHGHEQSHHGLPTVAWLLLLPVALACFSSPAAVATHEAGQQLVVEGPGRGQAIAPLPLADPIAVPLNVYSDRALAAGASTLDGRTVLLVGFVAPDPQGRGWTLARLRFRCCLADARPVRVRALGVAPPPSGSWVRLRGTCVPSPPGDLAQVHVESVEAIQRPSPPQLP